MDHTNKGVAFLNDKTKDNQPDFKGRGNWKGEEFELAMWERTSKDGKAYYSISFSEPYKKTEGAWEQQRQKYAKPDVAPLEVEDKVDLSEIPF